MQLYRGITRLICITNQQLTNALAMDLFELAPGEVWEDRYDPQHETEPGDQAPAPVMSEAELADLPPWF